MTSEEERIVSIDKRQESFETFMRSYIDGNEKRLDRIETEMRDIKSQIQNLSNQFNNALIAGGVGTLTIIITIIATFLAGSR